MSLVQDSPDRSVDGILKTTVSTLKSNQNVLFPVYPSGVMFDLLEILSTHLDSHGLGSVPFYYIAPMAKERSCSCLNIMNHKL